MGLSISSEKAGRLIRRHQGDIGFNCTEVTFISNILDCGPTTDSLFCSVEYLAQVTGLSVGHVRNVITGLKAKGIHRESRNGRVYWNLDGLLDKIMALEHKNLEENSCIYEQYNVVHSTPVQQQSTVHKSMNLVPNEPSAPVEELVMDSDVGRAADALIDLGMNEFVAYQLAGQCGLERVSLVASYVQARKNLHSPPGFARRALEESWDLGECCPRCGGSGKVSLNGVSGYTCELCHGTGIARKQPSQSTSTEGVYTPPPKVWRGFEDDGDYADVGAISEYLQNALRVVDQASFSEEGR